MSIADKLKQWSWETFFDVLPLIYDAMWATLGLTIASFAFALLFGFVWTALRYVRFKPFTATINFIMNFIRTTPPLVQIFFLYFAWPQVPYIGYAFSPWMVGMLTLGIHFSTYIAEIYRSGIEAIPQGQWEATTALNFSTWKKWTKMVLPQALPPVIPMLGNYLIIMFKEVPLTSAVGFLGMLLVAKNYGADYYAYIEGLTIVGLFFLILSYISSILIQRLEKRLNRKFRKEVTAADA